MVLRLTSLILYGPPGCRKTALAYLIASRSQSTVARINAVASGVEEMRRIIDGARLRRRSQDRRTLLFIDEIHRFNKAQQDVLMPEEEIRALLERALNDKERGLGEKTVEADKEALGFLAKIADGDARRALNGLEIAAATTPPDAALYWLAQATVHVACAPKSNASYLGIEAATEDVKSGHHVQQDYLPEKKRYYEPTDQGFEKELKARLSKLHGYRPSTR